MRTYKSRSRTQRIQRRTEVEKKEDEPKLSYCTGECLGAGASNVWMEVGKEDVRREMEAVSDQFNLAFYSGCV